MMADSPTNFTSLVHIHPLQICPRERADGRERQEAQLRPPGLGGVVQVGRGESRERVGVVECRL